MQHLLSLVELSTEQINQILDLGRDLKSQLKAGRRDPIFQHRVLGLLFEKPSLRTRVSFEALIAQHGGSSLYLGSDVGWQKREPACDFIPILTSYLDILVIRAKHHQSVVEAVKYSRCPVINGLTDFSHPCQALADVMTIREFAANLETTRLAYIGDANNVAFSLAVICDKLKIRMTIAAPSGFQFSPAFMDTLTSGYVTQTVDPREAIAEANFVYTDVWTSMGQEEETERRLRAFADYQINEDLYRLAAADCRFLHCLPARRGEEVTSEVIDGPSGIVVPQAENRLHAQKGLVAWLLNQSQ